MTMRTTVLMMITMPLLMMNTNFLEACRLNSVGKVVFSSSIGAYGAAEYFDEENDLVIFHKIPPASRAMPAMV